MKTIRVCKRTDKDNPMDYFYVASEKPAWPSVGNDIPRLQERKLITVEYTLADPVRRLVEKTKNLIDLFDSDSEAPLVINDSIDKLKQALNELEAK